MKPAALVFAGYRPEENIAGTMIKYLLYLDGSSEQRSQADSDSRPVSAESLAPRGSLKTAVKLNSL